MRKLATIRRISQILPIEGADLIVTAVIDGWTVVVRKDEFDVDDHCVYFEIDSFLPDGNPAWQHLVEKHPRTFDGKRGHRLRTVRLRGQLSQGFVIPVKIEYPGGLPYGSGVVTNSAGEEMFINEGVDVSEFLGIVKYEPPVPAELAGQVRGNFPGFIPKTDQERCQNLGSEIFVDNANSRYEISMKLDGTSFTGYYRDGDDGVCGRNWELKVDGSNEHNTLVRMYVDSGLQAALRNYGRNYAVQGELQGPRIQGNKEGFKSHKLAIFDIYDIDNGCYLTPESRHEIVDKLWGLGLDKEMIIHVPLLYMNVSLQELKITDMNLLLDFAKGPSLNAAMREGVVFKRMDGNFSFKVINNDWLLKNE